MDGGGLFVDGVLAVLIAWTGWQSVTSREVFRAVVLFFVLGLLLSLAWLRLGAPNVALAEAAVGAGLTGVLFLETLGHLRRRKTAEPREAPAARALRRLGVGGAVATAGGLVALLALGLEPIATGGVGSEILARRADIGVANAVTAVLLDVRAFDTLLEVAVVLLAVIATLGLAPHGPAMRAPAVPPPPRQPLLVWFVHRLAPVALLAGAYLWWIGGTAPGGAFQAAAVVGAVYALLRMTGLETAPPPRGTAWRLLLVAGVAAFVLLGLAMAAGGRGFLDWPAVAAHGLIVALEAVLAASLGACLVTLVAGVPRHDREAP